MWWLNGVENILSTVLMSSFDTGRNGRDVNFNVSYDPKNMCLSAAIGKGGGHCTDIDKGFTR